MGILSRLWPKRAPVSAPKASADARFARCIVEVLKHEGGYVNDRFDPGGETNFGISKRAYPHLDIAKLSVGAAKLLYREDYWKPIGGEELPPGLDLAALDYAVNSGITRAAKCLQRAVGVADDGVIGPKTRQAFATVRDPALAIRQMCDERLRFLRALPTHSRFGRGWERRVNEVLEVSLAMAGKP